MAESNAVHIVALSVMVLAWYGMFAAITWDVWAPYWRKYVGKYL